MLLLVFQQIMKIAVRRGAIRISAQRGTI